MGDAAEQIDLPGYTSLTQSFFRLVTEFGGKNGVGRWKSGYIRAMVLYAQTYLEVVNLPAAAMEKGTWIALSSSWVMNEGWAAKPTSILLVFKKRATYCKSRNVRRPLPPRYS
jgi:hypothetical protein